jgi:ATP-binding cassette subfamily B protein/subfamily B ATP-binding cassette protein MsbA
MDLQLTLASLVAAPLMAGLNLLLGRRTRDASRATREAESRMQAHVHQTLTGIDVVQAFAREDYEYDRFRDFAQEAVNAERRGAWVGSLSDLVTGIVVTCGTGVVLFIGSRRVLAGAMSVGSLLVFLAYLVALYDQMKAIIGAYRSLQGLGGQIDRVLDVLDTERDLTERNAPIKVKDVCGEIAFENVSFGHVLGTPTLQDIDLHVRPGETVAIVGPTGAGKSTLVSLIPRFCDPWWGRIMLDGRDLCDLSLQALREHVSIVLQDAFLFPISIAENIAYGRPDASRDEIEAAARAARADDFIRSLPHGYNTLIGERGATLSGGERQRLNIARAILKDAPILILDEPTSALDAETEALLVEAIETLTQGRTTFIIAHRLSTIRAANRIVVMQAGRICESGTHDELIVMGGLYAEMSNAMNGHDEALTLSGGGAS